MVLHFLLQLKESRVSHQRSTSLPLWQTKIQVHWQHNFFCKNKRTNNFLRVLQNLLLDISLPHWSLLLVLPSDNEASIWTNGHFWLASADMQVLLVIISADEEVSWEHGIVFHTFCNSLEIRWFLQHLCPFSWKFQISASNNLWWCCLSFRPLLQTWRKHYTHNVHRLLAFYTSRTTTFRETNRLLLCCQGNWLGNHISSQQISKWLVSVINLSYLRRLCQNPCKDILPGHLLSLQPFLKGVQVKDICKAATWSQPMVFVKEYRLDIREKCDATFGQAVISSVHAWHPSIQ